MSARRSVAVCSVATALGVAVTMPTAQDRRPGPFTAEQAQAGQTAYAARCATCHGARLEGAFEAPPWPGETSSASGVPARRGI